MQAVHSHMHEHSCACVQTRVSVQLGAPVAQRALASWVNWGPTPFQSMWLH